MTIHKRTIHKREGVLVAVVVGSLISLAKEIGGAVARLYAFALTPSGPPTLMIAILLLSAASLAAALIRKQ